MEGVYSTECFSGDVSDDLIQRVNEAKSTYLEYFDAELCNKLFDYCDTITPRRKNGWSYASQGGWDNSDSATMNISRNATHSTIRHEFAHNLMGMLGYDDTAKSTIRANKNSYKGNNSGKYPHFAFGSRDMPAECYMLRPYKSLDSFDRKITRFGDMEPGTIFHSSSLNMLTGGDYTIYLGESNSGKELYTVGTTNPTSRYISDDIKVEYLDRWDTTPGMEEIETGREIEYVDEWRNLAAQVNRVWYRAALLVRKRGDKRQLGEDIVPGSSGYYLTNTNEFMAKLIEIWTKDDPSSLDQLFVEEPRIEQAIKGVTKGRNKRND